MDWKRISHLTKFGIRRLQNKKLRAFMKQLHFHPYYSALFKRNGIAIDEIKSTDDLVKIPFTTKDDIAPTKADLGKPRKFVLQPTEELLKKYAKWKLACLFLKSFSPGSVKCLLEQEYKPIHLHFTAGRTSLPVPFLYSKYDIEKLREAGKRMMNVFGVGKDAVAVNSFPYVPHLAFWQAFFGLNAAGLLALHTGGGKILGTKKIADSIQGMKASLIIAMPGYAYHLIRTAAEQKKNFSSVKHMILGGERVALGLRDKLRGLLEKMGAKNPAILATYAFTEGKVAWPECSEGRGYHLYPDMEFIEIIGKDGERVEEGEKGEITYTALDWRGSVVLRYKTGDIGKLISEKCECGRTTSRIDPEIERKSEIKGLKLVKVKGTLVNLNLFFPLLMGNKDIEEWQVEIKKKNNDPYEVDELAIYVAPRKRADFSKLKENLGIMIKRELDVTPIIIKMDLKELLRKLGMETELKEKRIIDTRSKLK